MKGAVTAALVLVGTLGCQRDRAMERVIEHVIASNGRESKVTIDRSRASITIDLGAATQPEGWPAAVPFYPHATRARLEVTRENVHRMVLTSDDSVAAIDGYYSKELARLGWQVDEEEGGKCVARRGAESLRLHVVDRKSTTRAEIEYRASGSS